MNNTRNIKINQNEVQALINYVVKYLYHYNKQHHDTIINYRVNADKAMTKAINIIKKHDQEKGLSIQDDADIQNELSFHLNTHKYNTWVHLIKNDMTYGLGIKSNTNALSNLKLSKNQYTWLKKDYDNKVFHEVTVDDVIDFIKAIIGDIEIRNGVAKN